MATRETIGALLAAVNAGLNAICAVLLFTGRRAIARGERVRHRGAMLAALGTSTLFLASYLTRVYLTGTQRFVGPAWLKLTYLAVLFSHMILAIVMLPMIARALWLATRGRFEAHRRLARKTYPVWMYVSVTGVFVYVLLYHVRPALS